MGRRRRFSSQADVDQCLAKQVSVNGDGPYRSGVSIRDFNSFGICNRVYDRRTHRVQDFLSNGEYGYQEYVAFDQRILASVEQTPVLPIRETHTLALELGIAHPRQGIVLVPFRIDLFLTLRNGPRHRREVAIEVKERKAMEGRRAARILEKQRVLEIFYGAREVPYLLVYKEDLNAQVIRNLRSLRYAMAGTIRTKARRSVAAFSKRFVQAWSRRPDASLEQLATNAGADFGLNREQAIQVFQLATWQRRIPVDLTQRILPCLPLARTSDPNLGVIFPW